MELCRRVDIEYGELGKCPYCGSMNYERGKSDWNDDALFVDCFCVDCKNTFSETFLLKYQAWKKDDSDYRAEMAMERAIENRLEDF